MPKKLLSIERILAMLTETPRRMAALSGDLTAEQLQMRPEPDEWSANEVLAHLRACADVWGDCMAVILNEDEPTIQAVHPRTWIKKTDYGQQAFTSSLQAFTAQRADLLATLESLAPEAWEREATVTGAGKPRVWTVYGYARRMARHEAPHVEQIARIVKAVR
jgi:hypothetical protein